MKASPVYVYVAGPYSSGDVPGNVRRAISVGDRIMDAGGIPYIPHLTHYQHLQHPRHYEEWMELDFAWLRKCDVVYRLDGHSPGADREVALAQNLAIPVVYEGSSGVGWGRLRDMLMEAPR